MDHIGIDVHKKESQICILAEGGELIERRIRTEPRRFAEALSERASARILLESATESEWVARCLEALGHHVVVADPGVRAPLDRVRERRAGGRPYPYMCLQSVINLQVWPVSACVKVDDTVPGVEEGLNAGMWTVGLAMSGNEIGLPLQELKALAPADLEARRQRAYTRMWQCGAHYVVDSIADLMPCLDDIEARLSRRRAPLA